MEDGRFGFWNFDRVVPERNGVVGAGLRALERVDRTSDLKSPWLCFDHHE